MEDDVSVESVCFEGTDDKEENRNLCLLEYIGGDAEKYLCFEHPVYHGDAIVVIQGDGYETDEFNLVTQDYYERNNEFTRQRCAVLENYLDSNDYPDPDQ
jgi:hypothetical protein